MLHVAAVNFAIVFSFSDLHVQLFNRLLAARLKFCIAQLRNLSDPDVQLSVFFVLPTVARSNVSTVQLSSMLNLSDINFHVFMVVCCMYRLFNLSTSNLAALTFSFSCVWLHDSTAQRSYFVHPLPTRVVFCFNCSTLLVCCTFQLFNCSNCSSVARLSFCNCLTSQLSNLFNLSNFAFQLAMFTFAAFWTSLTLISKCSTVYLLRGSASVQL